VNDSVVIRTVWVVNVVVLAIGINMTASFVHTFDKNEETLDRKVKELAVMQDLRRTVGEYEVAKSVFEVMPSGQEPVILADLLKAKFSTYRSDHTRASRQSTVPGWVVKQQEVELDNVPFKDVMVFVKEAEAGRPPWRLQKCVFKASSRSSGKGQVVLTMQALKRL
jgi:hypothetical protein